MMRPIVVITGASAGVGRATAVAFARASYDVALLARDSERLQEARVQIESLGGKALAIATDVARAEQVEAAAERIEHELGPVDVWINNAMTTIFARFDDVTPEEYERVTAVTYLGIVNGTRAALKRMKKRDRGCIIQVGSALAYRSIPLQSGYCGAKAAARGFTDSIRSELIHDRSNVRIAMIHLPALNTPQFDWARSYLPRNLQPVPPIFQPEVAADAVVWLAAHPRRELWVGWPTVKAILSTRLFPGLGDRLAAARAWDSQQTTEPAVPRPDNLFQPVAGEFTAHGRFDRVAKPRSSQLWSAMHRRELLWVAAALLSVVLVVGLSG